MDPVGRSAFRKRDGRALQDGQNGWYANLDLGLWENGDKEALFFATYGAADDRVNQISESVVRGLVGNGFVERRADDSIGIGAVWAELSNLDSTTDQSSETQVEAYYNAVVGDRGFIQPTVTGIFNVGGDSSIQDALVVSLRIGYVY